MVEEEQLLGSAQVRLLATCSPEHMVSGVTVCPCALIWGGVLTGACPGPLRLWGIRGGSTCPGRWWESVSILNTCECSPNVMTVEISLTHSQAVSVDTCLCPSVCQGLRARPGRLLSETRSFPSTYCGPRMVLTS